MTPHLTDRKSAFARVLLAGGGVAPCRSVLRDDLAAIKGLLIGMGLMCVVFVALVGLVLR